MRYLCIALCQRVNESLKLNKLNPQTNEKRKQIISGWFEIGGEQLKCDARCLAEGSRGVLPPQCECWGVMTLGFPEIRLWNWALRWLGPARTPPPRSSPTPRAPWHSNWPCSGPNDQAWSERAACLKNAPTLQTEAPPRKSWNLVQEKENQKQISLEISQKP